MPTKVESDFQSKWRPATAWVYLSICICDFIVFPILWSIIQAAYHGAVQTQWDPITLRGAGLFHLSMGAILGVAAFGRTQEKLSAMDHSQTTSNNKPFGPPQNTDLFPPR